MTDGAGEAVGEVPVEAVLGADRGADPGAEIGAELGAVRVGDADAFRSLFDRHAQEVYRYCARRSDDPAAAEDLVSVVFLEAWRCRSAAVVVDGSFRPWLFGIARNVTRTARRSAFRHRAALRRFHGLAGEVGSPDPADVVAGQVDATAYARMLEDALHALPAGDRDVAELCLMEHLTTAAAATVLGIPEGTVKSRLARVRGRWQRLLRSGEIATPAAPSGHGLVERPPVAPVGRT